MDGKLARWIRTLALGASCACPILFAIPARGACVINNLGEWPVTYNGVRVLGAAKLNGEDVRLTVDTGAFASLLSEAMARQLGVDPRGLANGQIGGIGGYARNGAATIDLTLGTTKFPREAFVILPGSDTSPGLSSLIGRELLLQHDLDFDLPDGLLRFVKPVGCGDEQMVFWDKPYSEAMLERNDVDRAGIIVKALVNGRPVLALIDSGAPFSTITTGAAQRVGLDMRHATAVGNVGGLGHGRMEARVARFDSFTLGDETIKHPELIIADLWHYNKVPETGTRLGNAAVEADHPEMLLGADFLKAHRVLFSPSHSRIYFSYMGGPVFQKPTRRDTPPAAVNPPPAAARNDTPAAAQH